MIFLSSFSNLFEQNIIDIRKFYPENNKLKKYILIILFNIWLFSSLIISKSFNGLLLNSFFYVEHVPVVTTLQDILDNKPLNVRGSSNLRYLSRENFNLTDIIEKAKKNKKNYTSYEIILKDVANGDLVLLANSILMRFIKFYSRTYLDRIVVSDTKYIPNYTTMYVR